MITAWMLLISLSLILARFYKPAFPGKTVCGVQIWFAVSCPDVRRKFYVTIKFAVCDVIVEPYKLQQNVVK